MPTARNNPPVEMPWLIIWMMAPFMPWALKEYTPSMMKPMWLTDEYATRRFMSVCTMAVIAP